MRPVAALLLALAPMVAPASASPIFGNGFEACCTVGGSVAGLADGGLVLRLESGAMLETQPITANGGYRFQTVLPPGAEYAVNIESQPVSGPACHVLRASGIMPSVSVTDVDVACSDGLRWDTGLWDEAWQ
jgi:hypothetical protein